MQFGFRTKHSTETASCLFIENIKHLIDKGGVVGAVFLDLKKAFDTVNHKVLLTKLYTFNFSEDAVKWVETYLSDRSQSVRVHNIQSKSLNLSTGVPQDSNLGPLFFALYINELPTVCPEVNVLMYVDDGVIYVYGKTKAEVAAILTKAMTKVTTWLEQCCLQLNVSKTVSMFFTKTQSSTDNPHITVSGENLQVVNEFKYLGVWMDSNLSFNTHVQKISNRVKFNLAKFRSIRN